MFVFIVVVQIYKADAVPVFVNSFEINGLWFFIDFLWVFECGMCGVFVGSVTASHAGCYL